MRPELLRLIAIIAILIPASAGAYYVETRGDTTEPMRFADGDEATAATVDVEYRVNASTFPAGVTGVTEAIDAAFTAWTTPPCSSLVFTEGSPSDSTDRAHWMSDAGSVYVLVYFTDTEEEWTSGLAVGHFYFGYDTIGALIGATVVLNSRDHAWSTDGAAGALDVQSIVTALVGRALGITSALEDNATFPRYSPGDTSKRVLGDDDLAGLAHLYPTSDASCTAPPPPEDVCDGTAPDTCPPRPTTSPGDAGTILPGDASIVADAGAPRRDAGGTTGGGGGGGGCSIACSSRSGTSLAWVLAMTAIGLCRRRARRR